MAVNVELITGHGESDHISSFDMRVFNRSIFGNGRYIFSDADNLEVSAEAGKATITIKAGSCMWSGMHIRIEENGTLSYLVPTDTGSIYLWLHYTRDASTSVESVNFEVTSAYKVDSSLIYDVLPDEVTNAYTLLGEFTHDKGTTSASAFRYSFAKVPGLDDYYKEATQKLNALSQTVITRLDANVVETDKKLETLSEEKSTEIKNTATEVLGNVYEMTELGTFYTSGGKYDLSESVHHFRFIYIDEGEQNTFVFAPVKEAESTSYNSSSYINHGSYVSLESITYRIPQDGKYVNISSGRKSIKKGTLGGIEFDDANVPSRYFHIYGVGRIE